jgi:hypothetical protein
MSKDLLKSGERTNERVRGFTGGPAGEGDIVRGPAAGPHPGNAAASVVGVGSPFRRPCGGVSSTVRSDVSFKTFMGRGCGETFQIAFGGSRVGPAPIPRRPHGAGTLPRRRKLRRHRPDLRGWRLAAGPPTGRRPAFFQPPSRPPGLPTGPARRCFCVSPCPRHAAGSSGWRARAFWLSPPRRRRGPRCGRGPCR